MLKILEIFPKLKSREKQPPQAVIEEMRAKHREKVEQEKRDKPKNYLKDGAKKKTKKKK